MTELGIIKKTLTTTAALVALLGGVTVMSIMEPPAALRAVAPLIGLRGPASVTELPDQAPAVVNLSELNLTCRAEDQKPLAGYNNQIRIKGENCLDGSRKRLKTVAITNLTNGFSATVFQVSETQFTTDYIALKEGENQLQLVMESPDAKQVKKTLTVTHSGP